MQNEFKVIRLQLQAIHAHIRCSVSSYLRTEMAQQGIRRVNVAGEEEIVVPQLNVRIQSLLPC